MEDVYEGLLTLQELDLKIEEAQTRLAEFAPELEEIDGPARSLEHEVEGVRARLAEMRTEIRRLERGAEEKRDRLRRYQDRMNRVRNAREEAAVRTELDLVRRAAEADEQEAVDFMDQATRTELKLDELAKELNRLRAEAEPRREALLEGRASADAELAVLRDRRENHAVRLEPSATQLYERVRAGKTRTVLATLTADGACGHCFSMVPIQQQAEIRGLRTLARCEVCGVILYFK